MLSITEHASSSRNPSHPSDLHAHALLQLRTLFPTADPDYLIHALSFYRSTAKSVDNLVSRVSEKVLEGNFGVFPTVVLDRQGRVDETRTRNRDLLTLNELFGHLPVSLLRRTLLDVPHSGVYAAVRQITYLLSNPKSHHSRKRSSASTAQGPKRSKGKQRALDHRDEEEIDMWAFLEDDLGLEDQELRANAQRFIEKGAIDAGEASTSSRGTVSKSVFAGFLQLFPANVLPRSALTPRSSIPLRSKPGSLHRVDLFRSSSYVSACLSLLSYEFPSLSIDTIRGVMTEAGDDYSTSWQQCDTMEEGNGARTSGWLRGWTRWFGNVTEGNPEVIQRAHTHRGSKPDRAWSEFVIDDRELEREVWEARAAERTNMVIADEEFARELNRTPLYTPHLLECECCFGDYAFEDLVACTTGSHLFCLDCVSRHVREIVFGQGKGRPVAPVIRGSAPQRRGNAGNAGEGDGDESIHSGWIGCMSANANLECGGTFSDLALRRALPPDVYVAYERALAQREIDALCDGPGGAAEVVEGNSKTIQKVQCPFCPYAELDDEDVMSLMRWGRRGASSLACKAESGSAYDGDNDDFNSALLHLCDIILRPLALSTLCAVLAALVMLFAPLYTLLVGDALFPSASSPKSSLFYLLPEHSTSFSLDHLNGLLSQAFNPRLVFTRVCRYLDNISRRVLRARRGTIFRCRNLPQGAEALPAEDGQTGELAKDSARATSMYPHTIPLWSSVYPSFIPPEAFPTASNTVTYCGRLSCLRCSREYQGPSHTCFEDEGQALRLAVEKAMAEAVKRVCPRCGVSFVKSDGCNKMVCRCGLAMCYVCRSPLTNGYKHFCQHFRPRPGPCLMCDKCDLYKTENEDEAVRAAARRAKIEFLREHPSALEAVKNVVDDAGFLESLELGRPGASRGMWRWLEEGVDACVAGVVDLLLP